MLDCRLSKLRAGRCSETVSAGQSRELAFLEPQLPHVPGPPTECLEACSWASKDVPQDRPELPSESSDRVVKSFLYLSRV